MGSRVGDLLGNYRLIRLLGDGGFAEVYLGEHLHLGSLAALKVLHTTLSEEEVEAFRQEARVIARLEHPHIVRVLDFDVQAGFPFLVMGFAPGGTLRQSHPRGSQLPLSTVLDYVAQVASALQYAHENSVIHRDIKPENLLVGRNNEVLLGDFGIALLAQSSQLHGSQGVVGTAAYMAPEQFRGKPCRASDQYALAAIVYEWLTGSRLFSGTFVELASQHMYATPAPIQGKAAVSPAVEHVVLTALAKDPAQRYRSVKEFASSLEQAARTLSPTIPASGRPGADRLSCASAAPTLLPISSAPVQQHSNLIFAMRQTQADGDAVQESPKLPRGRRTAIVRAICFGLLMVSVLLWLATLVIPTLHGWFAGAVLLSLVLWIAAYSDHRRETEQRDPRAGRKGPM
jgi:serine/threonine protein kinase